MVAEVSVEYGVLIWGGAEKALLTLDSFGYTLGDAEDEACHIAKAKGDIVIGIVERTVVTGDWSPIQAESEER